MKKFSILMVVLTICISIQAQNPESLMKLNHNTKNISATVWNDGFIGDNPVDGQSGVFIWKGQNGIWCAGIVYGTSLVGSVNGSYGKDVNYIDDWENVESNFNGGFSNETIGELEFDQVSWTQICDSGVPNQLYGNGFNIIQKSFSKYDENVIFFRYGFINTTGLDITNFYVGHTTAWEIGNYQSNVGGVDLSINLTYVSQTDSTGPYFGVVAIDSLYGCKLPNDIPLNIREETFNYISIIDTSKPNQGSGGTVGGTFTSNIAQNDTAWFTFAYVAGDDLGELKENAQRAIELADIAEEANWISMITSVDAKNNYVGNTYDLKQNYPNPFNPTTTIKYSIPSTALSSIVTLKVFDILGREVAKLVNEKQKPGSYEVDFSANNFSSGVFFYKLQVGNFEETKKMLFIK